MIKVRHLAPILVLIFINIDNAYSDVCINENGNIIGISNIFLEKIQGREFWKDQELEIVNRINELTSRLSVNENKDSEYTRRIKKWNLKDKAYREKLYRDFPNLKPSQEDIQIEELQNKSWEIESDLMHMKSISRLNKALSHVRTKLNKEFGDYNCINDCGGHEAGYKWAMMNNITNADNCKGKSKSFIEGCITYVKR